MKNIILIFLFSLLFFSCAQDSYDMPSQSSLVSFDVTVPSSNMKTRSSGTRAFADGSTVSVLKCYVYQHGSSGLPMMTQDIEMKNYDDLRGGSLAVDLPAGKVYDFVFVATSQSQNDMDSKVIYDPEKRTLSLNYDKISTNDEGVDCFYNVLKGVSAEKSNHSVSLKRPFAQLNIGTKDLSEYNELSSAKLSSVGVSVEGVYKSMDVMDGGVVGSPVKVSMAASSLPSGQSFPVPGASYLAMDYLLVNERTDVGVTMTASNGSSSFDVQFADVPVLRNYQTNIYGNLLTKENDFKIKIDPAFGGSNATEIPDDPYAQYDVVLKTTDIKSGSKLLCIFYDENDNEIKSVDLLKYVDSQNMIKITWNEIGIDNAYRISFSDSYTLESVIKLTINKLNIKSLKNLFSKCGVLTSVDAAKDWNTSDIIDLSRTFSYCGRLTNLDLSNWDTSNVTNLEGTFNKCVNLESIDLNSWNTLNVTNIAYLFSYCLALKTLDLSKWNIPNVIEFRSVFEHCHNLKSIKLPIWNTTNFVEIPAAFSYCLQLENLDFSNWNVPNLYAFNLAFSNCSNLQSIAFLNLDGSILGKDAFVDAFDECRSLKNITGSISNIKSHLCFQHCPLTHESIMRFINALTTVDTYYGSYPYYIDLKASVYNSLSQDEISLATNKNWKVRSF